MALDGVVIRNIVKELRKNLLQARISKIAQPEKDALLFTCKSRTEGQKRLYISASASLPLIYFTEKNKPSPMTAPNFCMLLRKHISGGRITDIIQPDLERIIRFEIEHLNELGDPCKKTLIVELMGKHSNIIFVNENGMILDSIKHVSAQMSSLREVLPGRDYFMPETQHKLSALSTKKEEFLEHVLQKPMKTGKAIYSAYTGISPLLANELCYRANIDADAPSASLSEDAGYHLFRQFELMAEDILTEHFSPQIVYQGKQPLEFSSLALTMYEDCRIETADSISHVLETYYADKDIYTRIRQKSVDLRRIVSTALERNRKKYDLQLRQLKDTQKREKFKLYGELLHTYGYQLEPGARQLEAENFYTGEMVTVPLDPTLSAADNAKKYFDKYSKMKRTFEALSELIKETKAEIDHLDSITTAFDIAVTEDDLSMIKEELISSGYIRRRQNQKKISSKSKPFHYISSDGFHMYVGKNNYQNDELTFKFASGNDWWFHAKGIPGSHVIVKTNGEELPDRAYEEAGSLAAYYSRGKGSEKVEIDYLQKKNVKKPNGAKPGFVIYYTNYSLSIAPDISSLTLVSE